MVFREDHVIREIVSSKSRNFRTKSCTNCFTLFMQQAIIFSIVDFRKWRKINEIVANVNLLCSASQSALFVIHQC